jgi:hypothetical protein
MQYAHMKLILITAAGAAMLVPTLTARAASPQVGAEYELSKGYETSQQTSDGSSSGSSNGRDIILERVTAVRETGLELEYDLPKDATAEDRARSWQFPARIFKPLKGPIQLLNGQELERRLEGWLKAAKWTREICGRWIFTWNAFRIECDPQSVIKTIEAFDLRSIMLSEGAPYREIEALAPGTLAKKAAGPNGATFAVVMDLDPDAIRRARAEADVAVGEMMQKPVAPDAALRERAKESISGTISVTFETDSAGGVWRRTKVTKLETKKSSGQTESEIATETVERTQISGFPTQH